MRASVGGKANAGQSLDSGGGEGGVPSHHRQIRGLRITSGVVSLLVEEDTGVSATRFATLAQFEVCISRFLIQILGIAASLRCAEIHQIRTGLRINGEIVLRSLEINV